MFQILKSSCWWIFLWKKKHVGCIIQPANTVYGGAWMDDVYYPFHIWEWLHHGRSKSKQLSSTWRSLKGSRVDTYTIRICWPHALQWRGHVLLEFCRGCLSSGCCAHLDSFTRIWSSSDRAQWQENTICGTSFISVILCDDVAVDARFRFDPPHVRLDWCPLFRHSRYGRFGHHRVLHQHIRCKVYRWSGGLKWQNLVQSWPRFECAHEKTPARMSLTTETHVWSATFGLQRVSAARPPPKFGEGVCKFWHLSNLADGVCTFSYLIHSLGIVLDRQVNIYILQYFNHSIRMVAPTILTILMLCIY